METKKSLGQFYTKNSKYIIGSFLNKIPEGSTIIDPFCGEWDLLNLFGDSFKKEAYDLAPKNELTIKKDTLLEEVDYNNKWVITNPPYLARNKNSEKDLYDIYKTDDLYKIALKKITDCLGGIIILPINFFSSEDKSIREEFISQYIIEEVNVFEDRVFEDTSYTVCSFFFHKKENCEQKVNFKFIPSGKEVEVDIRKEDGFSVCPEIEKMPLSKVKANRLLKGDNKKTSIFINCIDSRGKNDISFSIRKEQFFGKKTDRAFATIYFDKEFSEDEEKQIIEISNKTLNEFREKYNSLFLTNFRDYGRKRISFEIAYNILRNSIYKIYKE
jgi:hypothetical protein